MLEISESKIRYREDPKYVKFPKYPKLMALSLEAGATGINIIKIVKVFLKSTILDKTFATKKRNLVKLDVSRKV